MDIIESNELKEAIQYIVDKFGDFDIVEDNFTFSHLKETSGRFYTQQLVSKIFRAGIDANENNKNLYWCEFNDGEIFYYLLGHSHEDVVEQVNNWNQGV
jgi:hypothetical protein